MLHLNTTVPVSTPIPRTNDFGPNVLVVRRAEEIADLPNTPPNLIILVPEGEIVQDRFRKARVVHTPTELLQTVEKLFYAQSKR